MIKKDKTKPAHHEPIESNIQQKLHAPTKKERRKAKGEIKIYTRYNKKSQTNQTSGECDDESWIRNRQGERGNVVLRVWLYVRSSLSHLHGHWRWKDGIREVGWDP